MALTNERLLELAEIYADLKIRIMKIDEIYSLDYVVPSLDMPDSLNLVKLEYTPKTEEELTTLATRQIEAAIIAKRATLDKNYNEKLSSLETQKTKALQSLTQKTKAAQTEYEEELENIRIRLINNGLIYSTIRDKYNAQAREKCKATQARLDEAYQDAIELANQQQKDAQRTYQDNCNSLAEEKSARITAAYQKLVADEEKLARNIEKYNNGLEEKEQKYQALRERTYENARRAAYDRVYKNSKLYMQMGEVGYRRLVEREKYYAAQDAFFPLRREEANAILAMDSFLMFHLGEYYDAFVDWANTTLLP